MCWSSGNVLPRDREPISHSLLHKTSGANSIALASMQRLQTADTPGAEQTTEES